MRIVIRNIAALIGALVIATGRFKAVEEATSTEATPTPTTTVAPTGATSDDFKVSVSSPSSLVTSYRIYKHGAYDGTANPDNCVAEEGEWQVCIADFEEFDLFFKGFTLTSNFPASLCAYKAFYPYYYAVAPYGVAPSRVSYVIDADSNVTACTMRIAGVDYDCASATDSAEKAVVSTVADIGGSLRNKYFAILTEGGNYYVWFQVGGTGTNPSLANYTGIQVNIVADDTNATVATAVAAQLNLQAGLGAVVAGNAITIRSTTPGSVTFADGDSTRTGFSFTRTATGSASVKERTRIGCDRDYYGSLKNTHFTFSSAAANWLVWFSIDGVGAAPVIAGPTAIQVDLDENASAAEVASAIVTAITGSGADAVVTATADGGMVTITNKVAGAVTATADGSGATGFGASGKTFVVPHSYNGADGEVRHVVTFATEDDVRCPYNYEDGKDASYPGGENCCVGSYTKIVDDGTTTTTTTEEWQGDASKCIRGPGRESNTFNVYGQPTIMYYEIPAAGISENYTVKEPINIDSEYSYPYEENIFATNFFTPRESAPTATCHDMTKADFFNYKKWPTPFYSTSMINGGPLGDNVLGNPFYRFDCYDHNEDLVARIDVLVRKWNKADQLATTDSNADQCPDGDPDTIDIEASPFDVGYPVNYYTDRLDWDERSVSGGHIFMGFGN